MKIKIKPKKLVIKVLFWLTMEIFLSYLGLDYLADYGEFISTRNSVILFP